jgi:Ca2+-transporting ATPase
VTGTLIAVVSLAAALWAHAGDRPWQSVLFMVLGLAQLGVALGVRARRAGEVPRNNMLAAAVALSVVLQVAAVVLSPLQSLLGTESLTAVEWLVCAVLGAVPGTVLAGAAWLRRVRQVSVRRRVVR